MIRFSYSKNLFSVRSAGLCLGLALAMNLVGCTTVPPGQDNLRRNFMPRWETNEVKFEEANPFEQFGRNVRDGMVGIIDNIFQAAFSISTVGPTAGYLVQKTCTVVGDVIGLIDDNEYTEHVFKGVFSRQFLKFGSSARDTLTSLTWIHDGKPIEVDYADEEKPPGTLDYIGNDQFHTEVYGRPSGLATLGAVIIADLLIRPMGNLALIFQQRETAEKIDDAGIDLIVRAVNVDFY